MFSSSRQTLLALLLPPLKTTTTIGPFRASGQCEISINNNNNLRYVQRPIVYLKVSDAILDSTLSTYNGALEFELRLALGVASC